MTAEAAHIDFETRSRVDIAKRGAEAYARDASTEIMCLCYAIGSGPVRRWLMGEPAPAELLAHVAAGRPVYAHNAPFELWIWAEIAHKRLGWPRLEPAQTFCTMAMARAMSLPGALDKAAHALGLPDGKDLEGRRLMLRLCKPTRDGLFECTRDELERLAAYCARDVEVERELHRRLPDLIPSERALWVLDFEINARGVPIDLASVAVLSAIVAEESAALKGRLKTATLGMLTNPRAVADIKNWLLAEGVELSKLNKDAITRALGGEISTAAARAVLEIRKQAGKASTAKLVAMLQSACSDARARGLLSYYGADTGRWAGRRVQTQNMPRSPKGFDGAAALDIARDLGRDGLAAWYGSAMDATSWALRSLIKAEDGKDLIACDYSNIEGRCLAWEAGEAWKLDAFRAYDTITGRDAKGKELRAGPDLYVLAYSKSFGVSLAVAAEDANRQIGKVQELALGYQGGRGAFASMAANYGITVLGDDEPAPENMKDVLRESAVLDIVRGWREAHPNVVQFWRDLDAAAIKAVRRPGVAFSAGPVAYKLSGNFLLCRLPSGRCLSYPYPSIVQVPNWDAREILNDLKETVAPALDATGSTGAALLASSLRGLATRKLKDGAAVLAAAIHECFSLVTDARKLEKLDDAADTLLTATAVRLGDVLEIIESKGGTRDGVRCYGTDSKTRQWGPRVLYGGLLSENVTQAIARDILAEALPRLEARGYRTIMHVHDEIVCEVPAGFGSIDEMSAVMCELPTWAEGLPLTAAGWCGQRYRK